MKNKTLLAMVVATTMLLTACGSTDYNQMQIQHLAAQKIGLASTDEVTITNIQKSQPDALNGVEISYTATTVKGKVYKCNFSSTPALMPFDKPNVSNHNCELGKK